MFLWRALAGNGVDVGMSLTQMLSYTYINALLSELLLVGTMLSTWNYDGQLLNLYVRPAPIFGQVISHTIGGWLPMLVLFSLPMLCVAPIFKIYIIPSTMWVFPSLLLCISLGFAVDFIFACVTYTIKGNIVAWICN